jgi:hypothetical protein
METCREEAGDATREILRRARASLLEVSIYHSMLVEVTAKSES